MSRAFGFLGILIVVGVGMYIYMQQMQSTSAPAGGMSPKAAIDVTGVKRDLLGIANAERQYFATEGKYGSLEELTSGRYITIERQRPPFSYDIQTSAGGFRVVATRSGPAEGGPAEISVDETMQFHTSD